MKAISYFLLLCFLITNTVAMESLDGAGEKGEDRFVNGAAHETVALTDPQGRPLLKDDSEAQLLALQAQELLSNSMDLMTNVQTIEDVPFSILEIERSLINKGLVTSALYLKQTSGAIATCWNFVSSYSPLSLVQSVTGTTVSSLASMISEGDKINFPTISLNNIFDLFEADPDRLNFANYYLRQRAFPFEADGFNGTSIGYKGYAIIKDFAYGHRMVGPGEEHKVLPQYQEGKGKTRLDVLIALREQTTLMNWLAKRFIKPNPMVLRKLGEPYKDIYGNTCILYELVADPEGLIIEVMRKPKSEYEQLVLLWQERWRMGHGCLG